MLAEPFPQIAGFADVNHPIEPVSHQVNPRLMRHIPHFEVDVRLFFENDRFHGSTDCNSRDGASSIQAAMPNLQPGKRLPLGSR